MVLRKCKLKSSLILSMTMAIFAGAGAYAQDNAETAPSSPISESELRQIIDECDKTIPTIKNKDRRIDSLTYQVYNLEDLVYLLDEKISSLDSTLTDTKAKAPSQWPLPLLSDDVDVFKIENLGSRQVPPALQSHFEAVCKVARIDSLLNGIDATILETKDYANRINFNAGELIPKAIQPSVDKIVDLFMQLNDRKLSTFSEAQEQFVNELKSKYNKLSIYYE